MRRHHCGTAWPQGRPDCCGRCCRASGVMSAFSAVWHAHGPLPPCSSKKAAARGLVGWLCAGALPERPAWLGDCVRVLLPSARRANLPRPARASGQPGRGERCERSARPVSKSSCAWAQRAGSAQGTVPRALPGLTAMIGCFSHQPDALTCHPQRGHPANLAAERGPAGLK